MYDLERSVKPHCDSSNAEHFAVLHAEFGFASALKSAKTLEHVVDRLLQACWTSNAVSQNVCSHSIMPESFRTDFALMKLDPLSIFKITKMCSAILVDDEYDFQQDVRDKAMVILMKLTRSPLQAHTVSDHRPLALACEAIAITHTTRYQEFAAIRQTTFNRLLNYKDALVNLVERREHGHSDIATSALLLEKALTTVALKCLTEFLQTHNEKRPDPSKRSKAIEALLPFFSRIPSFQALSSTALKLSLLEGLLYEPFLLREKLKIFPQTTAKDKYLHFILATFALVDHRYVVNSSPQFLCEMMMVLMFDFQVDEYIKATGVELETHEIQWLISYVSTICVGEKKVEVFANGSPQGASDTSSTSPAPLHAAENHPSQRLTRVCEVLHRCVSKLLQNPLCKTASPEDRSQLRNELCFLIKSHLQQLLDNKRLPRGCSNPNEAVGFFPQPPCPLADWVHSTAKGHSAAPFSFAYFRCVVSATMHGGRESLPGVRQKHITYELVTRLSLLTRMYNDLSSFERDFEEGNLNSINFPEFRAGGGADAREGSDGRMPLAEAKEHPLHLAKYERKYAEMAMADLLEEISFSRTAEAATTAAALRLFVQTTFAFADVYMIRDLTNRVK